MRTDLFDFDLPPERIALRPASPRDSARMLVVQGDGEVVVVACPMCHSNLDMRRPEINKFLDEKIDIPVLYISQVLGLAVGLDAKTLGLNRHMTDVKLPQKPVKESTVAEEQQKVVNTQKMEA